MASGMFSLQRRRGYVYWTTEDNPHTIERASLSDGADRTVLRTANTGEAFGRWNNYCCSMCRKTTSIML